MAAPALPVEQEEEVDRHAWPCSCLYCRAMAAADDGIEPDTWTPWRDE